jgi:hypothetical protein
MPKTCINQIKLKRSKITSQINVSAANTVTLKDDETSGVVLSEKDQDLAKPTGCFE